MKDACVICGQETPYDRNTHIDERIGYIEGCGQLCADCAMSIAEQRQSHEEGRMDEASRAFARILGLDPNTLRLTDINR